MFSKRDKNSAEVFFKDFGCPLFKKEGEDWARIKFSDLDSLVLSSDGGLDLFTEKIDFSECSIEYLPPHFDCNCRTSLLKSVSCVDGRFAVECETVGSDFEDEDWNASLEVLELRNIFGMNKWFFGPRSFFRNLWELLF